MAGTAAELLPAVDVVAAAGLLRASDGAVGVDRRVYFKVSLKGDGAPVRVGEALTDFVTEGKAAVGDVVGF